MAEPGRRALGIYCLDVGQGDCTVIVPPEGRAIVFDAADQFVLERFVANHALEVGDVVVSHLDEDHIRGVLGFLRGNLETIDRVYIDLDRKPTPNAAEGIRALISQLVEWEDLKNPPIICKASLRDGDGSLVIREGDDWKVELVLPFHAMSMGMELRAGTHANMRSVVLRVSRAETAILIGGDAPIGAWEYLARHDGRQLAAAGIRVPHHGGNALEGARDWTGYDELYGRVGARLGVISVGSNNPQRWGHPHEEHVAAIRRGGACRLLCTQLTPRCHTNPSNELREALEREACAIEPPYRHRSEGGRRLRPKEVLCAGTVALWIDAGGTLHHEPGPDSGHARTLADLNHPMCTRALDTA